MPNIKSQAKRVEISAAENARNTAKKTKVKNAVKKFNAAIDSKDVKTAEALLSATIAVIDAAKSDGIYHKNTAARKVAALNKSLNTLKAEVKAAAPAAPAKKTAAKKAKAE